MIGHKVLERKTSKYNGEVEVIKTLGLGTYFQVAGLTQSGGVVNIVWKTTLRKIRDTKYEIRDTLILGLGGGSVAKLARKYWPEAKITGVEIDPVMVELGKKYLGLGEVDIDIKIQDAFDFFNTKYVIRDTRYDLILIDLYIGDEVPQKFTTDKFLGLILRLLTDDGIAVFNRLYYGNKRVEAVKFGEKLEKMFTKVDYIYPEANLMFICKND